MSGVLGRLYLHDVVVGATVTAGSHATPTPAVFNLGDHGSAQVATDAGH